MDDHETPLSWPERVQIAVDAAWGLRYLHDYFDPPFMHRDFKTSNILVTEAGKVCDLLPKLLPHLLGNSPR